MQCRKCGERWDGDGGSCPQCGTAVVEKLAGMVKTSTILISANDTEGVYHSVEEIPEPLRKKLLRSTNSVNSRTILIADRRGRQEIARALRKLPGAAQRRISNSLLTGKLSSASKLTVPQVIGMLLAGASGVLAWLILSHNW
jgi:hypothetical protein